MVSFHVNVRTKSDEDLFSRRLISLVRQPGAHSLEYLSARREDPQRGQGPAINHRLPVNQHLELAVAPPHHLYFRPQVPTKPRRHPDGVQS